MSRRALMPILMLMLTVSAVAGCAGGRVSIVAERSRYPISLSRAVRDQTGRLYDGLSLEHVGTLDAGGTRVGILYSALTIPPHMDISDEVNQQVAAAGGEAVVALTVSVGVGCEVLNIFPLLNALPLWPGCVPVTVTGDIVRRRPFPPPPFAVPAPPP